MASITALIAAAIGVGAGYIIRQFQGKKLSQNVESQAAKIVDDAKREAKETVLQAKEEAAKVADNARREESERRKQITELETRLIKREEQIGTREETLEKKLAELENNREEVDKIKNDLLELRKKQEATLEKIAGLTKDEAKAKVMEITEKTFKEDVLNRIRKIEEEVKEESDKKAMQILATAIQRMVWDHTAEMTTTTFDISSDEVKGRIIGKEGRNIHAFERATGVDLIVDDTPGTVTISSFDPVRREVARVSLERLIKDGRIQPARIEEVVGSAAKEVDKIIKNDGETAMYEMGVTGVNPDIVKLIGRLNYRFSFGQNVLHHSKEVGWLAQTIASEIGADPVLALKGGFLHDIGKAVDHEIEGSHAIIGADIARKYAMQDEIVDAIEGHLGEVPQRTVYSVISQVADAISGGRPGARRDSMENFIKRVTELENIAKNLAGVDKAFAIQAGRELRVIVRPEEIDDLTAIKLARNIADEVERQLKYPGMIKVNVIRETRAIEYAK